ncbi:MAG: glutamyl-tRNA reductase [Actinomycetota bacterium]
MPVLALGVSYRRAPVELLERLAIPEEEEPKAYRRLEGLDGIRGSVVLSTCNRVEVYADVALYHQGFQDLKRLLTEHTEVPVEELAEPLYSHYEDDAAEHLFSVAAGLDSMVLGEPQILAQVRAAVRRADSEGAAGPALADLFRRAVRAGRRVRAETGVGASPAAFVEAGADLAAKHLGGLSGRSVMLVGAGEMGSLAARTLRVRGVGEVVVLSRRPERAQALARRIEGRSGRLEDIESFLAEPDLVVTSTGASRTVISEEAIRRSRPNGEARFLLDLAVPRDVEPGARRLPGVALADIDDLREAVARRRGDVTDEVRTAREIVAEETRRYAVARRSARLAPLIEALHARGEEIRAEEVRRLGVRLEALPERDREAIEMVTRRIVRRLLHDPVVRLKDLSGRGAGEPTARTVAELFGIELDEE